MGNAMYLDNGFPTNLPSLQGLRMLVVVPCSRTITFPNLLRKLSPSFYTFLTSNLLPFPLLKFFLWQQQGSFNFLPHGSRYFTVTIETID